MSSKQTYPFFLIKKIWGNYDTRPKKKKISHCMRVWWDLVLAWAVSIEGRMSGSGEEYSRVKFTESRLISTRS